MRSAPICSRFFTNVSKYSISVVPIINELIISMDTYSIEMINSFIMGTTDIEYFDTFVKNLEQMGADRITEIYQNAYDAQFAK